MKLENGFYRVEVDGENGAIRRIFDKRAGLDLITEPRLAGSFRLLVPLADMQANAIVGTDQRRTRIEETPDGLTLSWDGPLTNPQGEWDLAVRMHIELAGEAVRFRLEVENRTDHPLGEAWYPLLGGITGVGERTDTEALIPWGGGTRHGDLFRNFPESLGIGAAGGEAFPEFFCAYPNGMPMSWVDFYNPKRGRGVYFACHDELPRCKVLRLEMHPGIAHGRDGNWPRGDELDRRFPTGVVMNWAFFPYTAPGGTFSGPPVVLQSHPGDWHAGARLYREWFRSAFPVAPPRDNWMYSELALQDTLFLSPEGNVLMRFADIPGWAADAARYGVKSVLISGWMTGGHDSHYPSYEPDRRLGTWEDLEAGIRACHAMGVRVFFFANVEPADCDTDWYRRELHRYRTMDAWGVSRPYGFGMGTLGARLGFTRRPLVNLNCCFPEVRELIVRQVVRLAELGADGVHLDKLLPTAMDFNPALPASADTASCIGTLRTLDEMMKACRAVRPDFALSVESHWDRVLQYSGVAWQWHDAPDHVPAFRFTFPEWLPTMTVTQPYDWNAVNNAVRFGYQLMVGPARYSKSMRDEPMQPLSAYIAAVLAIYRELRDTLALGEFLDTLEARVEADDDVKFNTHRNPETGRRACVLVNLGGKAHRASVRFEGKRRGTARVYRPFKKPRRSKLPAVVTVPGERLVVVVEE